MELIVKWNKLIQLKTHFKLLTIAAQIVDRHENSSFLLLR